MQDQFFVTGGSMAANAPSYIERDADLDLMEDLLAGKFCYVLTSRQMGKSSLTSRTRVSLKAKGVISCYIDLTKIGTNVTVGQWYSHLIEIVGRGLDLEDEVEDYLDANKDKGGHYVWSNALSELILPKLTKPLVIFVDEIDLVRSLPFSANEFFAGIREMYNQRASNPALQKLTFCLLGVATPSDLISEKRITPFNIGSRIELRDFTRREALQLQEGWAGETSGNAAKLVERAWFWTHGQPYLTQRLCFEAANRPNIHEPSDVDKVCADLFLSKIARERDANLVHVRDRLLGDAKGMRARLEMYLQVWRGRRVPANDLNPITTDLLLSGAVTAKGGFLILKNPIYASVFDRKWVLSHVGRDWGLLIKKARFAALLAFTLMCALAAAFYILAYNASQTEIADSKVRIANAEVALVYSKAEKEKAGKDIERAQKALNEAEAKMTNANKVIQTMLVRPLQKAVDDRNAFASAYIRLNFSEEVRSNLSPVPKALLLPAGVLALTHEVQSLQFSADGTALLTVDKPSRTDTAADLKGTPNQTAPSSSVLEFIPPPAERMPDNLQQPGEVSSVAFRPDGKLIAVTSFEDEKGSVVIWDVAKRKRLTELSGDGILWSVAWSSDGQHLACGGSSKTQNESTHNAYVQVWSVAPSGNGAILETKLSVEGSSVSALAFSPDGKLLATSGNHRFASLWRVGSWEAPQFKLQHGEKESTEVNELSFDRAGEILVTGGSDALCVWDVASGKLLQRNVLPSKEGPKSVWAAACSPDGKWAAAGLRDGNCVLFDRSIATPLFSNPTGSAVFSLTFTPDGKQMLSSHADGQVRVWDSTVEHMGDLITTLPACLGNARTVRCALKTGMIAVGGVRGEVRLWDAGLHLVSTPAALKITRLQNWLGLSSSREPVFSTLHPTQPDLCVCIFADGIIALRDRKQKRDCALITLVKPAEAALGAVNWLPPAFSPDGKHLGVANAAGTVWLYAVDASKGTLIGEAAAVPLADWADRLTLTNAHCLLGLGDKMLVRAFTQLPNLTASVNSPEKADTKNNDETEQWTQYISSPIVASSDNLLWMGDGTNFVYDTSLWKSDAMPSRYTYTWSSLGRPPERTYDQSRFLGSTHKDRSITACAFHPDGIHLALAHLDHTITLWEYDHGKKSLTLLATDASQSATSTALAFRNDGALLASATGESVVRLLEVRVPRTGIIVPEDKDLLDSRSALLADGIEIGPISLETFSRRSLLLPPASAVSVAWWRAIRDCTAARLALSQDAGTPDKQRLRTACAPVLQVLQEAKGDTARLIEQSIDAHPWLALLEECHCQPEWFAEPGLMAAAAKLPTYERVLLIEEMLERVGTSMASEALVEAHTALAEAYDERAKLVEKRGGDVKPEREQTHKQALLALQALTSVAGADRLGLWKQIEERISGLNEAIQDEAFEAAFDEVAPTEAMVKLADAAIEGEVTEKARWQKAMDRFDRVLKTDPDNYRALNTGGVAAFYLGDYVKAIKLQTVAANLPNATNLQRAQAWTNAGVAWKQRTEVAEAERMEQARKAFANALRLDASFKRAYVEQSELHGPDKEGRLQALQDLLEARKLDPSDTEILNALAKVYLQLNRHGDAMQALDDLVAKSSTWTSWRDRALIIGENARSKGDYANALAALDKAMELQEKTTGFATTDKSYVSMLFYKAQYLYEAMQYDVVLPVLDKILKIDPNHTRALALRGGARRVRGEFNQAMEDFNASLKQEPDNAMTFCRRASLWLAMGNELEAQQDFERGLKASFTDASRFVERFYLMQGTKDSLRKLEDIFGRLPQPLNVTEQALRAKWLAATGKVKQGLEVAQNLVAQLERLPKPPSVPYVDALSMTGRFEDAETAQLEARAQMPDSQQVFGGFAAIHCWRARGGLAGKAPAEEVRRKEIDLAALNILRGLVRGDFSIEWLLTEPAYKPDLHQHPLFKQALAALSQPVTGQERWLSFARLFGEASSLADSYSAKDDELKTTVTELRDAVFQRIGEAQKLTSVDMDALRQDKAFTEMQADPRWSKTPAREGQP